MFICAKSKRYIKCYARRSRSIRETGEGPNDLEVTAGWISAVQGQLLLMITDALEVTVGQLDFSITCI
jgi:hypothetical protein